MNYIKIRIGKDLSGMDREFRRAISDIFRMANPMFTIGQHAWIPHTDIFETAGEIVVTSELAGVNVEDIHVDTDRRTLKIYGIRREMTRRDDGRYLLAEIPSGYFERIISLSYPIDTETVTASYSEGLLQISLKKLPVDQIHNIAVRCI